MWEHFCWWRWPRCCLSRPSSCWWWRCGARKAARPGGRQDPLAFSAPGVQAQFGPRQLGPGAIVSYGGVDYVVRGSVTYREGPFVWWEHLLEGGDQPLWFSVEEDDGRLELAMWVTRKDLVALQPGGASRGRRRDVPRVRARSRLPTPPKAPRACRPGGEMEFVDCANAGETALLSFERWAPDMPWEVSTGKSVLTGELTVYPAPPPGSP